MDWPGIVKTVPDRRERDTLPSGFRAGLILAAAIVAAVKLIPGLD